MFHLISFSPHFIVHVSSHFLQSTLRCSCSISFPLFHTSLIMFHPISFSPHLIVHVSSYCLQSTPHCSCLILFPSVHSPSHLFHLPQSISFLIWLCSYYMVVFIVHVSSYCLQSKPHCSCFILFPSVHSPSHLFHLPQSISFLIWLCSYYLVIQLHCKFHFLANSVFGI